MIINRYIKDEIPRIHLLVLPCTSGHHKVVDEQNNGLAIVCYGRNLCGLFNKTYA